MEENKYRILYYSGQTYSLPIYLHEYATQLGNMTGFDGNIGQIEEKANFTYTGNLNTITIYNTVNTNKYSFYINSIFTIYWGDGTSTVLPMTGVNDNLLSSTTHTYLTEGDKEIKITVQSPWTVKDVVKTISIPFTQSFGFPTDLGTLIFEVPYTDDPIYEDQTYLQDYQELTGNTDNAIIGFRAVGKSRVDEFKLYGSGNQYTGLTITSGYTGYTIDGLSYIDTPEGDTIITGSTEDFYNEEVYNGMITRNEHFIGFIDEPQIFSDVFVERGQMSVMEKNLRLSEIDNIGELENYGNGYFNIRKL